MMKAILVNGPSGSGKSTQAKKLVERVQEKGGVAFFIEASEEIGKYRENPSISAEERSAVQMIEDKGEFLPESLVADLIIKAIPAKMTDGLLVICGMRGGEALKKINSLIPFSLIVEITADSEELKKRMAEQKRELGISEKAKRNRACISAEKQKASLQMAEKLGIPVATIDATHTSIDETFDILWQEVNAYDLFKV